MTQFDSEYPDKDMERITLTTLPQPGYELVDSGGEEKLERWGGVVLARPDPQALWPKKLATSQWELATGIYEREGEKGKWVGKLENSWLIDFGGLRLIIKPSSFKHTGVFPEQLSNWEWMQEKVKGKGSPKILNLFGYTGGATLALAKAGVEVTHVDASKTAVAWARENAKLSGLEEAPVRWIVEDVLVYLRRELKRGVKYDGIIMDPPAFGHGPHDELWKFEEHFLELMSLCEQLLCDTPLFVLINGYAAGYSPLAFAYNLESINKKFGGRIEYGDLTIAESNSERLLPAGIFARWHI
jgi:23S rRNA (cytosine1962-C5)-methyltransferase